MLTSTRWLNDYLDPPATAEEQAEAATHAGFPLEGSEQIAVSDGHDQRQDFEMTSNRGDCVCHLGLAREVAAMTERRLRMPETNLAPIAERAADVVTVTNREPQRCPLYTARIIRGVTVGPSPAWLADRLIARGDIPRNNVVDATNFVLFELGQPTHVFDLAKLEGPEIVVRMAHADEPFLPIGEGEAEVKLRPDDLVIADAGRAVAIAGVKGGALTAVSEGTTDILLEAATFDPVSVRQTSRRLNIASDSSYRFERGVHPGQVDAAAERLADLIIQLAGGEMLSGSVDDGAPIPERRSVSMRPERCRALLGVPVDNERMMEALDRLGFEPRAEGDRIACRVPVFRLDIEREVDLIEEVGRMFGHGNIPVNETIEVRVKPPQPTEMARRAVSAELIGMGFVEAVTHSLVSDVAAEPFLPAGAHALRVADDRAKAEPVLQPSVIPGLLRVRAHNRDNGIAQLRVFESAAVFHAPDAKPETEPYEGTRLGLLMDAPDGSASLRPMRGVVQRLAEVLCGHDVVVDAAPSPRAPWLAAAAEAMIGARSIGVFGLLAPDVTKRFGLDEPMLAAELDVFDFYHDYPPEAEARALPSFPAIERDLSIVVADSVQWRDVEQCVGAIAPEFMEACVFVTTFRGGSVPVGSKSLTLRLRFRSDDRTLRHEEVDPQVHAVVTALQTSFDATVRS